MIALAEVNLEVPTEVKLEVPTEVKLEVPTCKAAGRKRKHKAKAVEKPKQPRKAPVHWLKFGRRNIPVAVARDALLAGYGVASLEELGERLLRVAGCDDYVPGLSGLQAAWHASLDALRARMRGDSKGRGAMWCFPPLSTTHRAPTPSQCSYMRSLLLQVLQGGKLAARLGGLRAGGTASLNAYLFSNEHREGFVTMAHFILEQGFHMKFVKDAQKVIIDIVVTGISRAPGLKVKSILVMSE